MRKKVTLLPFYPRMILICVALTGLAFAQISPPSRSDLLQMRQLQIEAKRTQLERQRLMMDYQGVPEQDNYDVIHYRIELDIDTTAKAVSGTVTMTGKARVNDLASVVVDLAGNMSVDAVGGDATGSTHTDNLLTVDLSQPVAAGDPFSISTTYHGQPEQSGFGAFGFDYHGDEMIIWSLSEPYGARAWWPCKDVPNDKADSVDIIVTVPQGLIVASNGTLVSNVSNDDGTRTFHWQERYPITTYLVSVAISNYATYSEWFHHAPGDSMEVQYYIYPEDLEQAQAEFTETVDMLEYFHEIFGDYPFLSEKYGIAQFNWSGGMEHQTITSQGRFSLYLTVHELAHMWWGDKITNANWHEIWLNEGFASYAEALYFEHTRGNEYFHGYMSSMDRDYPYPIYVDDTTSVTRIFHVTVYDKAGWFLHMLRHVVGDPTFFDILLTYSDDPRFAYGNATTAGFQSVCESVSGMELDWFFEPWIYHVGRPVYYVEWTVTDSASIPVLNLTIEQTQYPMRVLFPMPIDIAIETASGDTLVTVFNEHAVQVYHVPLSDVPSQVALDPDGWILKDITFESSTGGPPLTPTQFVLNQNYPNPFNNRSYIQYYLPEQSHVRLTVYDLLGQEIATLVNALRDQGLHAVAWDGTDTRGQPVSSGIYLYRVEITASDTKAGRFSQTRKMVLLR